MLRSVFSLSKQSTSLSNFLPKSFFATALQKKKKQSQAKGQFSEESFQETAQTPQLDIKPHPLLSLPEGVDPLTTIEPLWRRPKRGGFNRVKVGKRKTLSPFYRPFPGSRAWSLLPPEIQQYRLSEISDVSLLRIAKNPQYVDSVRRQCSAYVEFRQANPAPPTVPTFAREEVHTLPRSYARGEERINEKNPGRKGNKRRRTVPVKDPLRALEVL